MLNHVHLFVPVHPTPCYDYPLYLSLWLYSEQWQEWGRPKIKFYMNLAIQTKHNDGFWPWPVFCCLRCLFRVAKTVTLGWISMAYFVKFHCQFDDPCFDRMGTSSPEIHRVSMGFFGVPFPFNPSIAGDGPMPREDIPATRFRQFWLEAVPPAFLGVAPSWWKLPWEHPIVRNGWLGESPMT